MVSWLIDNFATLVISIVLTLLVISIVAGMIKNKKSGNTSCGCGCSGCSLSDSCHEKNKKMEARISGLHFSSDDYVAPVYLFSIQGGNMSIVIIGGNECMECRYKNLCKKYNCRVKVFTKMSGTLKNKIVSRFARFVYKHCSHKMVTCARCEQKKEDRSSHAHIKLDGPLKTILTACRG
jgi:hypothetical protein